MPKISASERPEEMWTLGRMWGVRTVCEMCAVQPAFAKGAQGRSLRVGLAARQEQTLSCSSELAWRGSLHLTSGNQNQVKITEGTATNNDLFDVWLLPQSLSADGNWHPGAASPVSVLRRHLGVITALVQLFP